MPGFFKRSRNLQCLHIYQKLNYQKKYQVVKTHSSSIGHYKPACSSWCPLLAQIGGQICDNGWRRWERGSTTTCAAHRWRRWGRIKVGRRIASLGRGDGIFTFSPWRNTLHCIALKPVGQARRWARQWWHTHGCSASAEDTTDGHRGLNKILLCGTIAFTSVQLK